MEQIPTTFPEFYALKPDFIRQLIFKNRWTPFEEVEDLEQELLCQLIQHKTVEKFDPAIYNGDANLSLFYSYVKECTRRCYLSILNNRQTAKRAVNNNPLFLSEPLTEDSTTTIADTLDDDGEAVRAMVARSELEQFAIYVAENRPSLIPVMDAIQQLGTTNSRELAEHLSLTRSQIVMHMTHLRKLSQRWSEKE